MKPEFEECVKLLNSHVESLTDLVEESMRRMDAIQADVIAIKSRPLADEKLIYDRLVSMESKIISLNNEKYKKSFFEVSQEIIETAELNISKEQKRLSSLLKKLEKAKNFKYNVEPDDKKLHFYPEDSDGVAHEISLPYTIHRGEDD